MIRIALISCLLMINYSAYSQIAADASSISPILVGEKIPEMTLVDTDNQPTALSSLIKQKPTVMIFYRGGWCPYCNAHLSKIAEIEDDIIKAGYQVIAISPDEPKQLNITLDKKELKYTLLSDADGKFTQAMGIAFKAKNTERKRAQLQKYSGGKNPGYLPVPSVFVINTKGEVMFEHINPKYSQRIESKLLMAVLNALH